MLLSVQDLWVQHGRKTVLNGITFSVSRGKVLGLYGHSGAGKSTTLLAIAGLLDSTWRISGNCVFSGHQILSLPPEKRSMLGLSIVLQGLALFSDMSVVENVAYPLERRRISRQVARESAAQQLARFHIGDLAARLPTTLSGGQQQRVALARAMVYDPSLLLLDEPFKGLEQDLRDQLLGIVRQLAKRGTSVILVTHDKREIHLAADELIELRDGCVVRYEQRSHEPSTAAPFAATADRVLLPASNGFPEALVPAANVTVYRDGFAQSPTARTLRATVQERRSLSASRLALLLEYQSGQVAWLEVDRRSVAEVTDGESITVAYEV